MVDGDTTLVISDETIIKVAERNIKKYDVVPLYYKMKKAPASIINNKTIYEGLNVAFTHGNIGIYSNNISKIWNSKTFVNGTDEEKQNALKIIKLLVMENNFVIDSAKTLYQPERPEWFKEELSHYTQNKLPHFFEYAKDKTSEQVEKPNNSFVNKLDKLIVNPRINTRVLGLSNIDYKLLMNNPDLKIDIAFTSSGKLIKEKTSPIIVKYCEINRSYGLKINAKQVEISNEVASKSELRKNIYRGDIISYVHEELSKFGYDDIYITDVLVKYLYGIKNSRYKDLLWDCYGDVIYNNLTRHFKEDFKEIQCIDCGEWIRLNKFDSATCRCQSCQKEYKRKLDRERKQKLKTTL